MNSISNAPQAAGVDFPLCVKEALRCIIEKPIGHFSLWFAGSRANNRAVLSSDWDFFLFAEKDCCDVLCGCVQDVCHIIDILVVTGHVYHSLCGEKHGSFVSWGWQEVSQSQAKYNGLKWSDDEEDPDSDFGSLVSRRESAYLIYRR